MKGTPTLRKILHTSISLTVALSLCACDSGTEQENESSTVSLQGVSDAVSAVKKKAADAIDDAAGKTLDALGEALDDMISAIPLPQPQALAQYNRIKEHCDIPLSDDQKFILACKYSDTPTLARMLENGYNPNVRVETSRHWVDGYTTPLHTLMRWGGDKEAVKLLLEHGADPAFATKAEGGLNLLCDALRRRPDLVNLLLEYKTPLQPAEGDSAPAFAAKFGTTATLKKMFAAGADVQAKDAEGLTLLHQALTFPDSYPCIQYICEQGADVNATDAQGRTPLMYILTYTPGYDSKTAKNWPHRRGQLVKLLLEHGAKAEAGSIHGYNTADVAYMAHQDSVFPAYTPTPALQALRSLADMCASGEFDQSAADALLPQIPDINAYTPNGHTLLTLAAHSGNAAMLAYLLDKGADPNKRAGAEAIHHEWPREGRSSMMLLPRDCPDRLAMMEALLKHGASPRWGENTPDRHTDLDWDGVNGYASWSEKEVLTLFADAEIRKSCPLCMLPDLADFLYYQSRGFDFLDFFFRQTSRDINERDAYGNTLLLLTPADEQLSGELVKMGADVHATNNAGQNLLMLAENPTQIRAVLALGVDIHAKDAEGNTALHYAVRFGARTALPAVKMLVEAGADIHAQNNAGKTALDIFRESAATNVVEVFFYDMPNEESCLNQVLEEYKAVCKLLGAE